MDKVIQLLIDSGYMHTGETRSETVKVITATSFPFSGAAATTGGRQRFELPDSAKRVTVGKRTTCFYEVENGKTSNFASFKTSDIESIKAKCVG